MKISRRIITLAAAGLTLTLLPQAAAANVMGHGSLASPAQKYNMVDMGTLGGAQAYFGNVVRDLNDKGQVVGVSQTKSGTFHGFLYTKGKMTDLGNWQPTTINNSGEIVGYYSDSLNVFHGVLWKPGMKAPSELPGLGGPDGGADYITGSGVVSGLSDIAVPRANTGPVCGPWFCHAYIYDPKSPTPMRDLGALSGGLSEANSVNDQGLAGGWSQTTAKDPFGGPVQWPVLFSGGKVIKQPMPGYVGGIGTVNQQGQAVGLVNTKTADPTAVSCSNTPQPHFFAATWQVGKIAILQPIAPYADTFPGTNNDAGVAVGASQPACSGGVATIWTKGKSADLNTMINNQGGASLYYAGAINNPGDIVAYGVDNANTNGTLFLLTPCSGGSCHPFKAPAMNAPVSPRESSRATGGSVPAASTQAKFGAVFTGAGWTRGWG
jgi:probable HAF family extracellular repeat protein